MMRTESMARSTGSHMGWIASQHKITCYLEEELWLAEKSTWQSGERMMRTESRARNTWANKKACSLKKDSDWLKILPGSQVREWWEQSLGPGTHEWKWRDWRQQEPSPLRHWVQPWTELSPKGQQDEAPHMLEIPMSKIRIWIPYSAQDGQIKKIYHCLYNH
jgi:hypothetical protein